MKRGEVARERREVHTSTDGLICCAHGLKLFWIDGELLVLLRLGVTESQQGLFPWPLFACFIQMLLWWFIGEAPGRGSGGPVQ